jgi:AraC family transcriptional regulator
LFNAAAVPATLTHDSLTADAMPEARLIPSVLPVPAVEVMRDGNAVRPLPSLSTLTSDVIRWNGAALESYDCVPGCSIPEHEHPTHFLNLLTSDGVRAEWRTNGRSHRALNDAGTIYLLPRGTRDSLKWYGASSRIIVTFDPTFLARAVEETAHLPDVPLQEHWNLHDRQIETLMRAMRTDIDEGCPAGRLYGEQLAAALAVYLVRRYSAVLVPAPSAVGGLPLYRLRRVLEYIDGNLGRDLRLLELATLVGMSAHHFSALFRASTGAPPHRYVMRQRLEKAKHLLKRSRLSVLEIALQTGFGDQTHFAKTFKRATGETPSAYRARA